MGEWKKCKIKDIARRITSGGTPSTKIREYYAGEIPWLNTKEIGFNRITDTEVKITEVGLNHSSAKWIEPNSVIVAMYGATAGKIAINKIPLTTNQACCNLTIDEKIADYNFVYYYLYDSYAELENLASGAAQQNLNVGIISDFPISLPPLAEQRAIAGVLSSLDDKIDLLHRENQTLEQIAETLFRQWFVEEASDDWEEILLNDIYMFDKGFEPGSRNYLENKEADSIRFIRVGDMLDLKASTYIKKEPGQITCGKKDLLVSFDGTIGRVSFGLEGAYSSGIRKVYSLNPVYNSLGLKYLLFTSRDIQDVIKSHSSGTVIAHAGSSIDYLTFRFPKKNRLQEFNQITDPMFFKITKNLDQIETLEKLRNNLLPKLISGEVRVKI